ncbi:MAG: thiolase family protein [Selenomonadaceae bacterium]|nr:thiolase family protein [Selenomonadaceae bacterium]
MNVYILGGLRSPIVVANTKFKMIRPEIFGAEVLKALREKFSLEYVDEIICGNAVGTGGNISRLMTLLAGFDDSTAALTVDRQCASGASAISIAYAKISCGLAEVIIAGGAESSSLQPLKIYHKNDDRFNLTTADNIQGAYRTAQFSPNELNPLAMLKGAQRVAEAEKISKDELDAWALKSHQRAANAKNILKNFIVEVAGVREDTGIKNLSKKILERAPLPLGEGTVISAANACRINDGAAFVVLASENFVREKNLSPAVQIVDVATGGVNPLESPRGAQVVADKLLRKNNLTYEDLAAIEFNEAFAVIDVLFERAHPNLIDKFNRLGGALAYGHPYGASGVILMIHLLAALKSGLGLLSIAGAGGTGEAVLIEALT